ncbi:unnamed protein product [Dracunculus medinensis]|uniref:Transmembrane protein n=1 Tax=Dracunculus medinensis TaxID=318479 RepID=A0A0N4UCQ2_DRAME|nr:unnamed protein product [Dracunculus medinensis]
MISNQISQFQFNELIGEIELNRLVSTSSISFTASIKFKMKKGILFYVGDIWLFLSVSLQTTSLCDSNELQMVISLIYIHTSLIRQVCTIFVPALTLLQVHCIPQCIFCRFFKNSDDFLRMELYATLELNLFEAICVYCQLLLKIELSSDLGGLNLEFFLQQVKDNKSRTGSVICGAEIRFLDNWFMHGSSALQGAKGMIQFVT